MLLDSVITPDFGLKKTNDDQIGAAEANFLRFARWVATDEDMSYQQAHWADLAATVVALWDNGTC